VRPKKGILAVVAALLLVAGMGLLGLGIDAGYFLIRKAEAQTAADAAALAALFEIAAAPDPLQDAGRQAAAWNGFVHGPRSQITLHHPPKTGRFRGDLLAVEAVIHDRSPTFFMRVAGFDSMTVAARSVARAREVVE
jgi:hypothetical protein